VAARRVIAALVAVALVVIALLIRNGIDTGSGNASGKLRLVCTPELESVCNKLGSDIDVTIEEPGTTAGRLEKANTDLGVDGWLTPGPWPEIVREARERAGDDALLNVRHLAVRSQIALAAFPDRFGALRNFCPNHDLTWRCLGDAAARGQWSAIGGLVTWGQVKFGLPDANTSATGLAALGAATAGYFGRTDVSAADLDDGGYRAWLHALATSVADHPTLEDVLARGPAEAAGAVTFEAVGKPLVDASARLPKPTLTYPAPVASADVVLGSADSDRGRRLAAEVESAAVAALTANGWSPAPTAPGLPTPGLLDALRSVWADARR
jgi:hypothetical protein